MENIVIKKKDGQIDWITLSPEETAELSNGNTVSLCWGNCAAAMCKHALPSKCKKIYDKEKNIQKYDFITDGVQDLEGRLVVTKCNNYEETGEIIRTPEEKRKARIAKRALLTNYFDAQDEDEAAVIHYMGIVKGDYEDDGDTIIPEYRILNLISEMNNGEEMLTEVLAYKQSKIDFVTRKAEKVELDKSIRLVEKTLSSVISKRRADERAHEAEINKLMEKGIKEKKIRK